MPSNNTDQAVSIQERNAEALQELRSKFANLDANIGVRERGDWRALMEAGAIASLKVSRFRGSLALQAGDLGIDAEEMEAVSKVVDLGSRLLLPREVLNQFNSIETRARQLVRAACLQTPAGLFLPAASYSGLAEALESYKARFFEAVEKLCNDLETHRETVRGSYAILAGQVYERLQAAGVAPVSRWGFEEQFIERCMMQFPTEQQLRGSFAFTLALEFLPLPYQTQSEEPQYMSGAGADLLALRREVIEQQRATREQVAQEFMLSVQTELYTLVNTALSDTLSSLQRNGNLQARSVVQLRNLAEKLGDLNFWGDRKLETIQAEIVALCDNKSGSRSADLSTSILQEIKDQTRLTLLQLERQERGQLPMLEPERNAGALQLEQGSAAPLQLPSMRGVALSASRSNSGKLF